MNSLIKYPSISGPADSQQTQLQENCIAFHKYDGSNLQFKWNRKQGWFQFGTRRYLIKPTNPMFGGAFDIFQTKYAKPIEKVVFRHQPFHQVQEVTAFCEFFGPHTFSGIHSKSKNEKRDLKLFDLHFSGLGFLSPQEFIQHFGSLDIAEVVYEGPLTHNFIVQVQEGHFSVREGVVAKGCTVIRRSKKKKENKIWRVKIKTKTWLTELKKRSLKDPNLTKEFDKNMQEQGLKLF